jgi:hypothetical protein
MLRTCPLPGGLRAKHTVMPEVPALPQSPDELLERLFAIFPRYRAAYAGPIHDDAPTFHSVLLGFTPFFGASLGSFSERQLQSFGALVSAAAEAGGALENAFGTCLLEHLHQIRALRDFRPHLSKLASARTKASGFRQRRVSGWVDNRTSGARRA